MSMMNKEDKDERFYRDTESIAFVKLDDRQLALLEPLGKRLDAIWFRRCLASASLPGNVSAV